MKTTPSTLPMSMPSSRLVLLTAAQSRPCFSARSTSRRRAGASAE